MVEHVPGLGMAEDEIVVVLEMGALAQRRQLAAEACGHRHRAPLVGLGRVHLPAREVVSRTDTEAWSISSHLSPSSSP